LGNLCEALAKQINLSTIISVTDFLPHGYERPSDFLEFWSETEAELQEILADSRLERDDRYSHSDSETFRVRFRSLNGIQIHGWLSVPSGRGPFPGLLLLPGYTQALYPPRALATDFGFCVLALSVRGHEGSRDAFDPGFPGLMISGIESRDTYVYRGIVADALRGFDVLSCFEKINPARIAVTGISQGGGLTLIVSSRRQVAAAAPDVPFLCGIRRAIFQVKTFPYEEIANLVMREPSTKEQVLQVLDYFDVLGFAPDIQCPVYMSIGLKDPTAPAEFAFECLRSLGGEYSVETYPLAGHEGGGLPHQILKMQWLKNKLT
jgi:cephalosporin-C deacetylase